MYITQLRGAYHRDNTAQHAVLSLPHGAQVYFQPEPNVYDPNTIKVFNLPPTHDDAVFIGYVAKKDCDVIHDYIETGYIATVHELNALKPLIAVTLGE